jgi:hypothetical protein
MHVSKLIVNSVVILALSASDIGRHFSAQSGSLWVGGTILIADAVRGANSTGSNSRRIVAVVNRFR